MFVVIGLLGKAIQTYWLHAEVISVDCTARNPTKLFILFKMSSLINILCFGILLKLYNLFVSNICQDINTIVTVR